MIHSRRGNKKAPPHGEAAYGVCWLLGNEDAAFDQGYAASSFTACIIQRGFSMHVAMMSANILRIGRPNMASMAMAGISISFMIVLSIKGFNRKTEESPALLHVFL